MTTLGLLDPVRAHEDYATLDHLSAGRLELIIGKGNGTAQRELFQVTPEDQCWEAYGHDPARAVVGAGTAGYYAARTSQEAIAAHRPVFEGRLAFQKQLGMEPVFSTLEDFVESPPVPPPPRHCATASTSPSRRSGSAMRATGSPNTTSTRAWPGPRPPSSWP